MKRARWDDELFFRCAARALPLVEEAKRFLGDLRAEQTRYEIDEVAHEESVVSPPSGGSAAAEFRIAEVRG